MTLFATCAAETNLRREEQLLLCFARTCMDPERAERISTLLEKVIDWEYLVRIAGQHHVRPLLYWSVRNVCPQAVPRAILEGLRDDFRCNEERSLFLTKELLNLLHLLDANKIFAIPYKGPVLAASVYGSLALRKFSDLDILVHKRTYQTVQHLLLTEGYRLTKEFEWESTFVDGSGRVEVDLHQAMTPLQFPCPLDFEYLSERLQRIVLAGTEVVNLSPEDTLLMLAIQVTKDVGAGSRYFKLVKVCDIAELLRSYPHLDLTRALRQAKRLGGQRMLQFSLCLTNQLLGMAPPQNILCKMSLDSSIDRLTKYARQQLFYEGDNTVTHQRAIEQFRWLVRERLRDKLYPYYLHYLRYAKYVMAPNELDRRVLALPRSLSFLYYVIRPIRLVGKYGSRLVECARKRIVIVAKTSADFIRGLLG